MTSARENLIASYPPGSDEGREMNLAFYQEVRQQLAAVQPRVTTTIDAAGAHAFDLAPGETLVLRLLEGPQIVNLFAFNSNDPDERLWVQDMARTEGLFLRRYSRLWGEMARYRPLLTVVEDTVVAHPRGQRPRGQHHFVFGGSGTPSDWRQAGGEEGVMTTYEQLVAGLALRDIPPSLLKDNVCLFQKVAIDGPAQRFDILASDAIAGDRVAFYSELDVTVLLALSPYIDGSRPAHELHGTRPRPVEASILEAVAEPLGWPYPGSPYIDLSLYLNDEGTRSTEPVPTPDLR